MRKFVLTILLCCSLCIHIGATQRTIILAKADKQQTEAWVDSVFNAMTPEERIGQLIAQCVTCNNVATSKAEIKLLVEKYHIGCIYFSPGPAENYAELGNYTNSISKTPVFVALDGEWGLSMRMKDTPRFPKNMMLGAIRDDKLLYEYGQEMAKECRTMGISVNFAPSVDVNSNPRNPVIGTRSYGEDPINVGRKAVAYSRGLEDGGVMSVAKHFPGHGDTQADSHKTLPLVDKSYMELQATDFVPFQNYIKAGLSGIMLAHLNIPALKTGSLPSSLCKSVGTDLLKDKMDFKGLVFTDALTMKGAAGSGQPNGLLAMKAGAEVLLEPSNLPENFRAMKAAYAKGGSEKTLIDNACKKILAYKYALGLNNRKPVVSKGINARVNTRSAELTMRKLFAAAITAIKNNGNILPLKHLNTPVTLINIGEGTTNTFANTCSKYTKVTKYSITEGNQACISKLSAGDRVIVGIFSEKSWSAAALSKISAKVGAENVIPVFFTRAYSLKSFSATISKCKATILAYESEKFAQEYAAQAVFGGIDVTGRTPVTIDGVAKCGSGVDIAKTRLGYAMPEEVGLDGKFVFQADSLAKEGLKKGAYTGCQVLVAKNGKIVFEGNYGYTNNSKNHKITESTLFDLASVSKATGTLPGIMKAIDLGKISLNGKLSQYIPALKGNPKGDLTITDLLYHETGIPAALNIYKDMTDTASYKGKLVAGKKSALYPKYAGGGYINADAKVRRDITSATKSDKFNYKLGSNLYVGKITYDSIMQIIHNIDLRKDKRYRYSCLNFCLLMEAEENATGIAHDKFLYTNIYRPLGAYNTTYKPLDRYATSQIASTEVDEYFRDGLITGTVHDETAAFSGGVQGNAGLFSTATDLAKYCQMMLNGGEYGGEQIISESTAKTFMTSKSKNSHRGLGFDKPNKDPKKSSTCEEADPSVVGHTGYTGTAFWIDPKNEIIYIFLSNRVCPTRNNSAFSKVGARAGIFGLVYQALERNK